MFGILLKTLFIHHHKSKRMSQIKNRKTYSRIYPSLGNFGTLFIYSDVSFVFDTWHSMILYSMIFIKVVLLKIFDKLLTHLKKFLCLFFRGNWGLKITFREELYQGLAVFVRNQKNQSLWNLMKCYKNLLDNSMYRF